MFSGDIRNKKGKRGQENQVAYKGRQALREKRHLDNKEEVKTKPRAGHRLGEPASAGCQESKGRQDQECQEHSIGSRAKPYGNTRNSALNEGHWVLFAVLTAWWGGNLPPPLTVQREVKGNVKADSGMRVLRHAGHTADTVHVHKDLPKCKDCLSCYRCYKCSHVRQFI